MILAANIGNTNTAVGLYRNGWERIIRVPTAGYQTSGGLLRQLTEAAPPPAGVEGGIVASVVPEKDALVTEAIAEWAGVTPRRIGSASGMGLDLSPYDSSLLGADRVLCCIGALAKYAPPLAVFDLGTAVSVSVVDAAGAFAGGAILPGVRLGLSALAGGTALLPDIAPGPLTPVIGRNTAQCLTAGAIYGVAGAISGYAALLRGELGDKTALLLTGGDADLVLPHCTENFRHEPTLLLDGLIREYGRMNG